MNYQIHQGAMPYDENMMNTFYKFAIEKHMILESQKKDEKKEKKSQQEVQTQEENNLEDMF